MGKLRRILEPHWDLKSNLRVSRCYQKLRPPFRLMSQGKPKLISTHVSTGASWILGVLRLRLFLRFRVSLARQYASFSIKRGFMKYTLAKLFPRQPRVAPTCSPSSILREPRIWRRVHSFTSR